MARSWPEAIRSVWHANSNPRQEPPQQSKVGSSRLQRRPPLSPARVSPAVQVSPAMTDAPVFFSSFPTEAEVPLRPNTWPPRGSAALSISDLPDLGIGDCLSWTAT